MDRQTEGLDDGCSYVTVDRFESRMERSTDGGKTWLPGNHQTFERQPVPRGLAQ